MKQPGGSRGSNEYTGVCVCWNCRVIIYDVLLTQATTPLQPAAPMDGGGVKALRFGALSPHNSSSSPCPPPPPPLESRRIAVPPTIVSSSGFT